MTGEKSNLLCCDKMISSKMTPDPTPSNNNARIIAALVHASILIPGIGILVPAILWAARKRFPVFIQQQTIQSLVYQLLQWVWIQLITLVVFFLVLFYAAVSSSSHLPPVEYSSRMLDAIVISAAVIAAGWAVYQMAGMVGAVVCMTGRSYKYPVIGSWISNYVSGKPVDHQNVNDSKREDQVAAAVAHSSILIPFMGFLIPLVLILFDKNKHPSYRFQLLQALVFQLMAQVISMVLLGCQVIILAIMAVLVMFMVSYDQTISSEVLLIITGLVVFVLFLITTINLLTMPLLATLGIIAFIQVIKGREYCYPVLGRRLSRGMGGPV